MVVLITGSGGQLGQAIKSISIDYPDITFHFADSSDGDITNKERLSGLFSGTKPDFCLNAAAYTAVDKAESDQEAAFELNVAGARNLAETCRDHNCTLIHFSTDFVFDGNKKSPYIETDPTNPIGVYGQTKRQGEEEIEKFLKSHFIIRTSWLFSEFGNNFMKTMLRLAKERGFLTVVNDQHGTPTNAVDLAHAALAIVKSGSDAYGIYHYSNEGETTWFGFAQEIFRKNGIVVDLQPTTSANFPTPAKRPEYSVMDKSKIKNAFGITIRHWKDAIKKGS